MSQVLLDRVIDRARTVHMPRGGAALTPSLVQLMTVPGVLISCGITRRNGVFPNGDPFSFRDGFDINAPEVFGGQSAMLLSPRAIFARLDVGLCVTFTGLTPGLTVTFAPTSELR